MTIAQVKKEIVETASQFPFIKTIRLLDETDSAVKFRLEIDTLTFIQVYHNVATGTVNFLLMQNFVRVYGRDCCSNKWHRHPFENPAAHDFSREGAKAISLFTFLGEVEEFLIKSGLL